MADTNLPTTTPEERKAARAERRRAKEQKELDRRSGRGPRLSVGIPEEDMPEEMHYQQDRIASALEDVARHLKRTDQSNELILAEMVKATANNALVLAELDAIGTTLAAMLASQLQVENYEKRQAKAQEDILVQITIEVAKP